MSYYNNDVVTLGLDSINMALDKLYPDCKKVYVKTEKEYYTLENKKPLEGVSIYLAKKDEPYWHYTTYGLTELYEKELEYKDVSGFGIEFTFRLKRNKNEIAPPLWPINFLQRMAYIVFNSGNVFKEGDLYEVEDLLELGTKTELNQVIFIEDIELKEMYTENGSVKFLQIVGITDDEAKAIKLWDYKKIINLFNNYNLLISNDFNRKSLLLSESIKSIVEEGILKEGSSTEILYMDKLKWKKEKGIISDKYIIILEGKRLEEFKEITKGRLIKNRDLLLKSENYKLKLIPSDRYKIQEKNSILEIYLSKENILEICNLVNEKNKTYKFKKLKGLIITTE